MSRIDLTRWPEVQARFDELVELDEAARKERLADIAARDPALHRSLEALLAFDVVADERLKRVELGIANTLSSATKSSRPNSGEQDLIGREISHFRILDLIAAGGMGVVYRAEDTQLQRHVALKFPLPDRGLDTAIKDRFIREARAAGALDHPNLCSVLEAGTSEDGQVFLAMPLYGGKTLKEKLATEAPPSIEEALDIARQIADGMACAHAAGIIHRDLKPGNLMLLPDGTVKILDFGLAKTTDLSHTRSGYLLGTAGYMAPEQIQGGDVGPGADLWALGVLLYEMIGGRRPFDGENELSIAHAVVTQEPLRPSELRAGTPRAVEQLVLNLLRKDPKERYESALAVAADIAAIQRGEQPTHRVAARRRAVAWLRGRNRRTKLAFAVMVVTVVASAGFGALLLFNGAEQHVTADPQAYDFYLRGREYESRSTASNEATPEALKAAASVYRQALARDPNFALARAHLANVLFYQYMLSARAPEALEEVGREAAAALQLQPELAEARTVMSFYWEMREDYGRALRELELGRRFAPRNPAIHHSLADLYRTLGRWDEALAALTRAQQLARRNMGLVIEMAHTYEQLRRHEEAARYYDRYLQMAPDSWATVINKGYLFARWHGTTDTLGDALRRIPPGWNARDLATQARVMLARFERRPADGLAALAAARQTFFRDRNSYKPLSLIRAQLHALAGDSARATADYMTAQAALQDSVAARPHDAQLRVALSMALVGLGRKAEAIREAKRAMARTPPSRNAQIGPGIMRDAAAVYAMLNENRMALQLLEQLLQNRGAGMQATAALLRLDPTWDPLRSDPGFQQLLAKYSDR